jgi:antitoxin component YwqK of YwqJK toxin-antitoxin module
MKIVLKISLIILLFYSCKTEKTEIISKYDNGQVRELIIKGIDTLPNGYVQKQIFHDNGNLKCQGCKSNELREGKWICYYKNGEMEWTGNYSEGKENGLIECFYKDGTWKKSSVKNDIPNGKFTEMTYDSTNGLFYIVNGQYTNGKEEGNWTYNDTNNLQLMEINYENGMKNGLYYQFHENGSKSMIGNYTGDQLNDTIKIYDNKNNLVSLEVYEMGELIKKQKMR